MELTDLMTKKRVINAVNNTIKLNADFKITEYPKFKNSGIRQKEDYERKNKSENGFKLSQHSKDVIRQRTMTFFANADFNKKNVTFATITITDPKKGEYNPVYHDTIIIKQFSTFLETLKRSYKLSNYIWVAERQQNGKIHFHAIFCFNSKFLSIRLINRIWLHYLSKVEFKIINDSKENRKKYLEKNENYLTYDKIIKGQSFESISQTYDKIKDKSAIDRVLSNPVDFQYIKTIKHGEFEKMAQYITKYISKNDSVIYGRPWSCTRNISKLITEIKLNTKEFQEIMQNANIYKASTKKITIEGKNMILEIECKYYQLNMKDEENKKIFREKFREINKQNNKILNFDFAEN